MVFFQRKAKVIRLMFFMDWKRKSFDIANHTIELAMI